MLNQNNQEGSFENDFSNIKFVTDNSKISLADLLSREKELAADYRIAIDGWGKTDLGAVVALDSCVRVHFTPGPDSNMEEIIQEYQFPANANLTIQSHPKYPHVEQLKTLCVEIPVSGEDRKRLCQWPMIKVPMRKEMEMHRALFHLALARYLAATELLAQALEALHLAMPKPRRSPMMAYPTLA